MNEGTRYTPHTGQIPVAYPPLNPPAPEPPRRGVRVALIGAAAVVAVFVLAVVVGSSRTPAPADPGTARQFTAGTTYTQPVAPSPVKAPTVAEFTVNLKTVTKKCFGSAGCNVVVEPQLIYTGLASSVDGCDVTYTVSGDDSGEVVETAYHSSGMDFRVSRTVLSTKSTKVVPAATVTGVSCRMVRTRPEGAGDGAGDRAGAGGVVRR